MQISEMKLILVVLVSSACAQLSCFTCHEANVGACAANGTVVQCQDNEESCQLTMRRRDGEVEQVQKLILN